MDDQSHQNKNKWRASDITPSVYTPKQSDVINQHLADMW